MKITRNRQNFVVPMNAMSDVAFLLLIFIMLVALINYRREVKIDYPEAHDAKKTSAEKNMEIWVDSAGLTYLDGLPASLEAIEEAVTDAYRNAPGTRVHLIADRNTAFRRVNEVLSVLQLLEYRVVSFVVKDE
ncbi:MAG: biopolymer transporter ExbD [Spirochaetales bacterium]|jgi:biopolymer transport protein ExbD|nr:biopolymer transporter ExbD [Spirochaetales bacterium]